MRQARESNGTQATDFVVVGAGSAGCVLADRLSTTGARVMVIEAGGSDQSVLIQMPSALSIPMNMPKYTWSYETEPEPHLGQRRLHTPRGRVLGGSSSINGLVYVRGNPFDFDTWEEMGARDWGFRHVLPYFQRAETRQEGGNSYRGEQGPLATKYGSLSNPLHAAWLLAAQQAGYQLTEDYNAERQEGFGRMDMTVRDGRRCSAANAYLRPAMKRPNLTVVTGALATAITFNGRKATGLRYIRDGTTHEVIAQRAVILAGGPINSPQLLKLSGVGPAGELRGWGINVVADLQGVGENLQDHLEFYYQVQSKQPVSLYSVMNPLSKAFIGARWLMRHDGLGATNHFESCGFIRSRAGVRHPDIQYHFLPLAVTYDGKALADGHGYQAHVGSMHSKSRGWIRLASAAAQDKPRILFNYMSHPDDWTELRAAVRLTREIFAQPAFDPFRGDTIQPGEDLDDTGVDMFLQNKLESAYHPCGTCRMGSVDDPQAVVDPTTRVMGIDNLFVVDSSIMPQLTTGNLNAPTIMLAEKGSDLILGREPPPASNAPVYQAKDWETAQR